WTRHGAAAILSFWKWLPLPDGGGLVLNGHKGPCFNAIPRPAALQTARRLAYRSISVIETALGCSPRLWLLRLGRLRSAMQTRSAEAPLAPRRCSQTAEAMIARADWQLIATKRRLNYNYLDAAVSKLSWAD